MLNNDGNQRVKIRLKISFLSYYYLFRLRGVAQVAERWHREPEVAGSSPAAPTSKLHFLKKFGVNLSILFG
jgi:hypothetical protein